VRIPNLAAYLRGKVEWVCPQCGKRAPFKEEWSAACFCGADAMAGQLLQPDDIRFVEMELRRIRER
jgi:hypothetical protein